jgi:hypothetical protein
LASCKPIEVPTMPAPSTMTSTRAMDVLLHIFAPPAQTRAAAASSTLFAPYMGSGADRGRSVNMI